MSCLQSQSDLHAYFDGEMSAIESAAFEQHLQTCDACQQMLQANERLRGAINQEPLYERAPGSLIAAIDIELDHPPVKTSVEHRGFQGWRFIALGSSLAAAACFAIVLTILHSSPARDDLLAQEIVASHIRAMMADHLLDVPSLDRHTVKPWFDGKLDFAPPVIDTKAAGFPLIGGRLDYIGGRPVAAVVFKRDQHIINLFIWTSGQTVDEPQRVLARQGYNVVRWSRAGMTFWAVSDLEMTKLQQFASVQQVGG